MTSPVSRSSVTLTAASQFPFTSIDRSAVAARRKMSVRDNGWRVHCFTSVDNISRPDCDVNSDQHTCHHYQPIRSWETYTSYYIITATDTSKRDGPFCSFMVFLFLVYQYSNNNSQGCWAISQNSNATTS